MPEYQYTTIDYGMFAHKQWQTELPIHMQMDYDEIVTGRSIDLSDADASRRDMGNDQ
jgi:hypothetical protein